MYSSSVRRLLSSLLLTFIYLNLVFIAQTQAQSRRQQPPAQTGERKNQRPNPNAVPTASPTPPEDANPVKDEEVLKIKTNIVNVDTVVYNKKTKQIVTGLQQKNFEIYEDGVKQDINYFSTPESPITVTMVVDWSKIAAAIGYYGQRGFEPGKMEMVRPVAMFLTSFIKPPNDYASVIGFDIRPTPLTDFTNNPRQINDVIRLLVNGSPAFTDSNLFDALKFTLVGGRGDAIVLENTKEKTADYAGLVNVNAKRRAIILVGTGIDSRSRINFDKIRRIVQSSGIPIYTIGTGEMFMKVYGDNLPPEDDLTGLQSGTRIPGFPGRLTLLQAKSTLTTFAEESGGAYFPVTFESEVPAALNAINTLLRSQYSLAYDAGIERTDTKKRKIVVKVDVNNDGNFDDAEQKQFEIQHRKFYVPADAADNKK